MSTVIKAWTAQPPREPGVTLEIIVVACDGGQHYHLFTQKEWQYETLPEADNALTESLIQASILYDIPIWNDDTASYDENPTIVRGEN